MDDWSIKFDLSAGAQFLGVSSVSSRGNYREVRLYARKMT